MSDPLPVPADYKKNLYRYLSAKFLGHIAYQIQSVAVAWQVYAITGKALDLGLVGLSQFLPIFLFSIPAGQVADRFSRKWISILGLFVSALVAFALFYLDKTGSKNTGWIYCILFAHATMRAFSGPANQSLLPDLVPKYEFAKTVALNSSLWQTAVTIGPLLGGLLYGIASDAGTAYLVASVLLIIAFVIQCRLKVTETALKTPVSFESVFAGIHYIWKKKSLLGAISLDLFAVLFGGAVALLPAIAKDILHTGPMGLGILRAAPGLGAALMAVYLTSRPIQKDAGKKMFLSVALFGLATVGFAFSKSLWLSFALLFITGAADMISVVVRGTLVQLETPSEMRGRVSSVNLVFISASNELGEFESGITAAWFGVIPSIIIGGLGTVLVALMWSRLFPDLRKLDQLL